MKTNYTTVNVTLINTHGQSTSTQFFGVGNAPHCDALEYVRSKDIQGRKINNFGDYPLIAAYLYDTGSQFLRVIDIEDGKFNER